MCARLVSIELIDENKKTSTGIPQDEEKKKSGLACKIIVDVILYWSGWDYLHFEETYISAVLSLSVNRCTIDTILFTASDNGVESK